MIILGILIKIIETILPLNDANMNLCLFILFISYSHILCGEGKKMKKYLIKFCIGEFTIIKQREFLWLI